MNIAFTAVESPLFRQLIELLNAVLLTILPFSGNTIKNWIVEELSQKKQIIKRHLHKHSSGMIHLSFDLWTSPNQLSLVGVVTHYVDDTYTVRTKLLSLKRLRGPHSGENLAQVIIKNALHWWRNHAQRWPNMARMAFDLLSIPAMSAECERVFSQAKLLITTQRNRLGDSIIEAVECLKHWYKVRAFE
jgi:hypothetical protein